MPRTSTATGGSAASAEPAATRRTTARGGAIRLMGFSVRVGLRGPTLRSAAGASQRIATNDRKARMNRPRKGRGNTWKYGEASR